MRFPSSLSFPSSLINLRSLDYFSKTTWEALKASQVVLENVVRTDVQAALAISFVEGLAVLYGDDEVVVHHEF